MDFSEYPITLMLIAANVLFSLIGFSNKPFLEKMIGWPYYEKKNRQYYRWISSGFLHADMVHLFFNMFTLYFFGKNVEYIFKAGNLGGEASYLLLYFLGLIIADLPGYFKHSDDYNYRSLGASGAVSAVVFAAIVFSPWSRIYIYGAIQISAALYAILYVVYCVYMSKKSQDNVNHDAHLWGSVFGLAFTLVLVAMMRPDLFDRIAEELKHPSLFGR